MTTLFGAVIGATALWLTYAWLASAIVCAYLSSRKGYGERPGLAAGLLLTVVGILVWLVWPARETSMWKTHGPIGNVRKKPAPTP
jgi:hypothetical protein